MDYAGFNTIGTLDSAPDGSIVNHIFGYVSSVLSGLEADTNENENAITHKLCLLLGQQKPAEYPYFFQHQNLEDKTANTSTDFAAYGTFAYSNTLNSAALVVFEAKRLSANFPHKREREYVIGEYNQERQVHNSGGIERFKNGRHGRGVVVAGLIGYVQTNDNPFWFQKINEWIQDEIEKPHNPSLIWIVNDKLLIVKSENRVCQCLSHSKRLSGDFIELRHLWVNLTQKPIGI
jgi:hypothetical protein